MPKNTSAILGMTVAILLTAALQSLRPGTTDQEKSPQDIVKQFIQLNLNEDFWPDTYRVAQENSSLARLGFGRRYANHYGMKWSKENSYFLSFVGYDREKSQRLLGYVLYIYVKATSPRGPDMARRYLRTVPEKGWIQDKTALHEG